METYGLFPKNNYLCLLIMANSAPLVGGVWPTAGKTIL